MKPLSYPLYDYILPHLDFNLRTSLSIRCASLSLLNQRIPTKINRLYITPYDIHINNVTYQLGVIQVHPNGQAPEIIENKNQDGGFNYDVNRYGFSNPPVLCDVLERENIVHQYETMKSQKEKAEKLGPAGTTTVNKCEEQMRKLYHVVLAYVLEKNNEDPPYTHQIQLRSRTFQSDYKEIPEWISIEKVEYQKSLIEAKDYLIKRFFSNKNLVIKVLKIEDITYLDKISASKISAETIDIGQFSNHEALWNSRNLIVRRTSDFDDFIDNLHLFKTKNFYFKDTWMELNVTMCQKLLRVLQGNVGARHLKITIRNEQNAAFLLDEIGLMPRAKYGEIPKLLCTKYPKCVILPKNLDQEINVYVTTDVVYNRCIHFKVNAKRNASLVR